MSDGVTDDIDRIQGTRMPWLNIRLGPEIRIKLYILYMYYVFYM